MPTKRVCPGTRQCGRRIAAPADPSLRLSLIEDFFVTHIDLPASSRASFFFFRQLNAISVQAGLQLLQGWQGTLHQNSESSGISHSLTLPISSHGPRSRMWQRKKSQLPRIPDLPILFQNLSPVDQPEIFLFLSALRFKTCYRYI